MIKKIGLLFLFSQAAFAQGLTDISYLQIRIGHPVITLGPAGNIMDNVFNSIKLTNGQFMCYTDNTISYRMTGSNSMCSGSSLIPIIGPVKNGYADCGLWIDNIERDPSNARHLYAFTHAETDCDYSKGQSFQSFAILQSYDEGTTWALSGQIITGTQLPTPGQITGEGNCSEVADNNYYYLYCQRNTDYLTFVARAPRTCDPLGGTWMKYYNGNWNSPGLGGPATGFASWGAPSYWADKDYIMLTSIPSGPSGIVASFSQDRVTFTSLLDPLLLTDNATWNRTASSGDLFAYVTAQSANGGRQWSNGQFQLVYMYLQPGAGFDKRYQVFRSATVAVSPVQNKAGETAQVGVELSRWINSSSSTPEIWTTNVPVPGPFTYIGSMGYTMTRALTGATAPATTAIEECVSNWQGNPDHIITPNGTCAAADYTRLRTLGWLYQSQQTNTTALYRCWSPVKYRSHFVSTQANCEGETTEYILGYIMSQ